MIYLVSYDLNKPEQDYPRLIDAIGHYENSCRVLKSQWVIHSDKPAAEIFNELVEFVDKNDELFVCEINENRFGRFKADTITQLSQNQMILTGLLGAFHQQ